MQGKQQYLSMVKANDCKKNKVTGCYKNEPIIETKGNQTKKCQPQTEDQAKTMIKDAKPKKQSPYTYNDTFAKKIKEETNKLKEAKLSMK